LKSWKKGAILGFLFIPIWFFAGWIFMRISAFLGNETLAGIVDAIFMIAIIPAYIILRPGDMAHIGSIYLVSILFWTSIASITGYFIEKRKE
jgi:hypothetical protein